MGGRSRSGWDGVQRYWGQGGGRGLGGGIWEWWVKE